MYNASATYRIHRSRCNDQLRDWLAVGMVSNILAHLGSYDD
jgi:hypothetical protein